MAWNDEESTCLSAYMGLELVICDAILMGCEHAEMSFRMVGGCIESKKRGVCREGSC